MSNTVPWYHTYGTDPPRAILRDILSPRLQFGADIAADVPSADLRAELRDVEVGR